MAPLSQGSEPPANPGRFTRSASQRFGLPPFWTTQRITLMAPTISKRRMSVGPALLTDPDPDLPPVDLCRGTRPSVTPKACHRHDAAKVRPLSKVSRSGANAATAPAVPGPIPGIVHSRPGCASVFDAASSSAARRSIASVRRAICSREIAPSAEPSAPSRWSRRPARSRAPSDSPAPSAPLAQTQPDGPGVR